MNPTLLRKCAALSVMDRMRAILAFGLAGLAAACSSLLPPQPPAPSLHLLDARPVAAPITPPASGRVLEVTTPRAWPGFDTTQMAYVLKPHTLDYFASHRWIEAPARMIAPLMAQAIEDTGAFRAVLQPPSTVAPDLRISTELVRLQHDFRSKPSEVELVLHVQLIDMRTREVKGARRFEAREPSPSEDPEGGVIAANRALARLLAEVAQFCAAYRMP